jgi:transcription-repair coupling factor (superfamily II helicase)
VEFLSPTCPLPSGSLKIPDIQSSIVTSPPGSFDRRLEQFQSKYISIDPDADRNDLIVISRSSERISEMVGHVDGMVILHGDYSRGYDLSPGGPVVISDSELFPSKQRGMVRARGKAKAFTRDELREVRVGDYMVHVHFGIGVFQGIVQQIGQEGSLRDYILLEYAQNDKLYVPVEQIDQLYRYTSAEGAAPSINRLGSSDWDRLKRKVKKNLVRIAEDLLKLYRTRMEIAGYQFSADTVWQKEVEDKFEYQETPGQLRSLDDLKSDMESHKPMDRLICAEVGYGKTELAVRAALKAVLDGKQVAVLVPTTILAQQHFLTFKNRLKSLPVSVGLLSRFRSRKEQKETLADLKQGKLDILIGTHRILSKDVLFNNLGLLVVDEEQKFGVRHKEKIKFLKENIDVLTLTATPIPRTLYMSLIGLRDISIIDTPPPDRLPIRTYVKRWNPHLVKTAIQTELARKGQVYYLHNRVETIHGAAKRLQEVAPDAKIAVAHGQMEETQLEKVMMEFMAGEHDVLVCTTIIENGLDISSVNTLIVEEAQNFGLAQLHQIRGRVGRSDEQAYAYFLFPPTKSISGLAAKRLEALASFSHLGAGYEIAKRDLELRGAGNILGPEQHGFVNQLGFDLYAKVLSETIDQVRDGDIDYDNIGTKGQADCTLKIPIDARIPTDYLLDQSERYALYRRLSEASTIEEIESLRIEIRDRFGTLPDETDNLLDVIILRQRAMSCGVSSITFDRIKKHIEVYFQYAMHSDRKWKRIGDLVAKSRLKPHPRGFVIPTTGDPSNVLKQVNYIIGELEKICQSIAKPIDTGART